MLVVTIVVLLVDSLLLLLLLKLLGRHLDRVTHALHLLAEMILEQLAWLHEVMVVQVAALVVLEVVVGAAPQKLQPEQALVWLLVAAVKELLAAVTRLERLFQLSDCSEPVLQGCILDLLSHFFMRTRGYKLEQTDVPGVLELRDAVCCDR